MTIKPATASQQATLDAMPSHISGWRAFGVERRDGMMWTFWQPGQREALAYAEDRFPEGLALIVDNRTAV